MNARDVKFHDDARVHTTKDVNVLTDTVKVTLEPKGHNVAIRYSFGASTITRDGMPAAKEVELRDHFEDIDA